MRAALGEADGVRFCAAFGITDTGNFEHGTSVIHRFSCAREASLPEGEDQLLRERLRLWRDRRVRPGKDDKVLAAWNGLALSALARGFQVLEDPRFLKAAEACADFLRRELWREGRLLRVWRQGKAHTTGFLEDDAAVIEGLVDLFEAGFNPFWLRWAEQLAEGMRGRFEDRAEGGFFSTEAGQADLLFRQKPGFDNALPSGNTLAARALLRLSRHLQREDFRVAAEGTMRCFGPWIERAPRAFLGLLGVVDLAFRETLEVAVAGDPADARVRAMLQEVHRLYLPGLVLSASSEEALPLQVGRHQAIGGPQAFVCHGQTCALPVGTARELALLLQGPLVRM
jgi:hypothetical protein